MSIKKHPEPRDPAAGELCSVSPGDRYRTAVRSSMPTQQAKTMMTERDAVGLKGKSRSKLVEQLARNSADRLPAENMTGSST
ncbi:hypothetical protein [Bradyrhizobium sp. CCGB01]|uniref:hypothetical protein n=1 Tax=Bradyrhizobium sp. CCGB01 TaxID=2949634 RepID=UPI002811BF9B|nr:hypothetical protein [Bradyrhizobium sp. CCGB01]